MSVTVRYAAPSSSLGLARLAENACSLWPGTTGAKSRPLYLETSLSIRSMKASASDGRPTRINHLGDSGSTHLMMPPMRARGAVKSNAQRQPRLGMISKAQMEESAIPIPKNAIIQPTNFPRIREGHNSARYGGTVELSAPTKSHVKKFKMANTPTVLDSPRHAEKIEYKISVTTIVFFRPTRSATKPQMKEPIR